MDTGAAVGYTGGTADGTGTVGALVGGAVGYPENPFDGTAVDGPVAYPVEILDGTDTGRAVGKATEAVAGFIEPIPAG